jgi:glucosamine 6-phosphate synthetase-like amidotransferase/phosphosugar isomerase protein
MVLTNVPDSSLAKAADQVVLVRAEGDSDVPAVNVCLHAALNYLALTAGRVLKRHDPSWESLGQEIFELPGRIEWTYTQFPALIGSLAAELTRASRLRIVGGGFYHYPAWQGAHRLQCLAGLSVEGVEASEFLNGQAGLTRRDDAVLYISGSRSKLKKLVHRSASQARVAGVRVLSITDGNDRDLAERSDLGILLPTLMEAAGCTLSLCLMEWLAGEAAHAGKLPAEPPRSPSP